MNLVFHTGSMPRGYGPVKTPDTLGSSVRKAFDCKVSFLYHAKIEEKNSVKKYVGCLFSCYFTAFVLLVLVFLSLQ